MVHLITGLPCRGLALCHIEVPFVLNQYGRPQDLKTVFILMKVKSETAKWYKIPRLEPGNRYYA